ncbi:ADP-heptose synthase [Paenibacillus antarcticus]|uniref:ADP-heptose synthase n=1 Tax=Paenibacillus antarcticus TaxID=253703 RepID=A0A168MT58_9BACL|nr:ADP-heptose synthase [Paenibacillus antarcticus]OAB45024.1 ADP-heptose synthase [Paenibacillus antarcticus]
MPRQFIIEAAMVTLYGELLQPSQSVEYIVPYTSILELYELQSTSDIIMSNLDHDQHVKQQMKQLTSYLEEPLNRKKIEHALQIPWTKSTSIPLCDSIIITVINAVDTEAYGEDFDPIETELLLIAQRLQIPLLTDQYEFIQRIIEGGLPVQVFDIEDFQFALEDNVFSPRP